MSQPHCLGQLLNHMGLRVSGAQRGMALPCHVELFGSLSGTVLERRAKGLSLELDYLDWSFNL